MGTTLQPANDNPSSGVGSGSEVMPRRIAEVSIRLDKTIKTKTHNNFVIRDMLPTTLRSESMITSVVSEYTQGATRRGAASAQNQDEIYFPKTFVYGKSETSLVSLGDYMIVRPEAVDQGTYITNSNVSAATAESSLDAMIRLKPSERASALQNFIWSATTPASAKQLRTSNMTGGVNAVIERTLLSEPAGPPTPEKIRVTMKSSFAIKRNQPFAVKMKTDDHQFDASVAEFVNNDSNWDGNNPRIPYAEFYPRNTRRKSAVEVEWGSSNGEDTDEFKVIFRAGGKNITLWKKTDGIWRLVGDKSNVPSANNDPMSVYMIYPAGRQLVIVPGSNLDSSSQANSVVFSFDREVNIPPTNITVHMYGAKMSFGWLPVLHRQLAGMVTPPMEPGIPRVENAYATLEFIGKKKIERDVISKPRKFPKDIKEDEENEDEDAENDGKSSYGELDEQIVSQSALVKQSKAKEEAFDLYEVAYQLLAEGVNFGLLSAALKEKLPKDLVEAMEFYPNSKVEERKNYIKYAIVVSGKAGKRQSDLVMSPVFERMQLMAIAPLTEIQISSNPQINASDIISVNVRQESQQVTGSFVLNNRFAKFDYVDQFFGQTTDTSVARGRYTYGYNKKDGDIPLEGPSNFVGVKPVTIRFGIMGGSHFVSQQLADYGDDSEDQESGFNQPIQFRGFITSRSYSRSSSGSSIVTCSLEDVSRRAKDHITMNLPIFDGWSNLAAMYYIARDAGYDDDEIVIYQDSKDPEKFISLYDILVEVGDDPHNYSGPSFSGHVNGFPLKSAKLDGDGFTMSMSVLHSCLPLNLYKQQPNYMFSAGQNTWDCMASIREFTGFYLYPNAFGKLVYTPPEIQFKLAAKPADNPKATSSSRGSPEPEELTYYESPQNGGGLDGSRFNNFQMHLDSQVQTENIRNAIALFGLIPHADNQIQWSPHVIVKRPNDLSKETDYPWFVPWLRWAIVKNPHWADPVRNERLAEELFNRLRRTMITVSFGLWGQPGHYAWQRFKVDESQMRELGIGGLEFVTTAVEHKLDATKKTYNTEVQGEHLDFSQFDFAPHVTGTPLRTYMPGQSRRGIQKRPDGTSIL